MADPSFNTVSQFAHAGVAYAITLSVLMSLGLEAMWWFVPIAVALAAVKEFWYDYKYESAEARGSSLEDFSFYMSGVVGALLFYVVIGVVHFL